MVLAVAVVVAVVVGGWSSTSRRPVVGWSSAGRRLLVVGRLSAGCCWAPWLVRVVVSLSLVRVRFRRSVGRLVGSVRSVSWPVGKAQGRLRGFCACCCCSSCSESPVTWSSWSPSSSSIDPAASAASDEAMRTMNTHRTRNPRLGVASDRRAGRAGE